METRQIHGFVTLLVSGAADWRLGKDGEKGIAVPGGDQKSLERQVPPAQGLWSRERFQQKWSVCSAVPLRGVTGYKCEGRELE